MQKKKFQETKSKNIKDRLSSYIRKCTLPCILLHWDEKQLKGEHQVDKSKTYIAVCISATNGSIPGSDLKKKFLTLYLWRKVIQKQSSTLQSKC